MLVSKQLGQPKPFPSEHIILEAKNMATTEICRQQHPKAFHVNKMLLDHFLLFVIEGTHEVIIGQEHYTIDKGEMFLIKKATYVQFIKQGNPNNEHIYESVSFSLKDDIILDFIKLITIDGEAVSVPANEAPMPYPYGARLQTFLASLKPYFDDQEGVKLGLYKLKILELLYDLSQSNPMFMQQLMTLEQTAAVDLLTVMEAHYLQPHSLKDLALISGRSLSSFRRDFEAIFHTTPAKWIQEKRLQKAKELLLTTQLPIAQICFEIGYENVSHFSRLYKSYFGYNPSETKNHKN